MNRQELYNQGKFFIRKRHLTPRGKLALSEPTWAIYVSKKFGSWELVEKFDTEEDCDYEIETISIEYGDCCIVEFKQYLNGIFQQ
jgi:hypothetical protein